MKVMIDEGSYMPERAHEEDAGYDLRTPVSLDIPIGSSRVINTGVHVQLPPGFCGLLVSKSGLNVKHGILSTGLIDAGYTGPIKVKLYNHGDRVYHVERGDKITQLVLLMVATPGLHQVDKLEETARGDKGFGSTGR